MNYNILIAEDDANIIELLKLYLSSDDFTVYAAGDGEKALELIQENDISLALVDVMIPKMNGYELTRRIREITNIPIIIISAKSTDTDKVLGLNIGADAYISKPFNPLEVVAYVKAALRRYYQLGSEVRIPKEYGKIIVGELELDKEKFQLKKRGEIMPLTTTELKIVAKLMHSPEHIFTKAQLYECINGEFYESDDNTMMVHISNIRSKIEDDPANPEYIITIRGLGYKIEDKKIS